MKFNVPTKIYYAIVAVALIFLGLLYLWTNGFNERAFFNQSGSKDWITYTNTQYGFELKHPATFVLKESKTGLNLDFNEKCRQVREEKLFPTGCPGVQVFVHKTGKYSMGSDDNPIAILSNGIEWKKITTEDAEIMAFMALAQTYENGLWYEISVGSNLADKEKSEGILEGILSTFTFVTTTTQVKSQ
ncbi:MAG: hypothetical protein ABI430_00375 [Candidatus Taylorbacteria bacterium]